MIPVSPVRRIIVDTYGGMARHGGGPSPARIRRRLTVPRLMLPGMWPRILWRRDWRKKCEIPVSLCHQVAKPVSIMVDTFGTGKVDEEKIVDAIRQLLICARLVSFRNSIYGGQSTKRQLLTGISAGWIWIFPRKS